MTISAIQLDTKQAKNYAKFLTKAPEILREESKAGILEMLLLLEREIKEDTPVGVTENLKGSVTHEMRGTVQDEIHGKVFSPLAYAASVEYGTRPHLPPWVALLDYIAFKHPDYSDDEVIGGAVTMALSISKKGTKGKHMFENNFNERRSQISKRLSDAIDRTFARLKAGE